MWHLCCTNLTNNYQRRTLGSPYVGMVRKQDGGSNGCISNYTTITWLGASVTHFETLFYPFWVLPLLTRPPKPPASNTKIAKWQPAKTWFCSSFFFFFFQVLTANKVAKKEVGEVWCGKFSAMSIAVLCHTDAWCTGLRCIVMPDAQHQAMTALSHVVP